MATKKNDRKVVYITYTDLFKMKQKGLEKLLAEHGQVFLMGRDVGLIKITHAEVG
jgi:hypothetical protein